jgi:hypothetical protein
MRESGPEAGNVSNSTYQSACAGWFTMSRAIHASPFRSCEEKLLIMAVQLAMRAELRAYALHPTGRPFRPK